MGSKVAYLGDRQAGKDSLRLFTMNVDVNLILRENLIRLMEAKGINQVTLSELMGVKATIVNDLLSDPPRRSIGKYYLQRLCEILEVDVWEFYITKTTPVITDAKEKEMVMLLREAGPLHVSEELERYGKFLIRDARERAKAGQGGRPDHARKRELHPEKGK